MESSEFRGTSEALKLAGETAALSDREKQLIGLAVTVTRGCSYCTGGRIKKAMESGISRDAIVAAIDLAAAVNAGVTIRTAMLGAQANACDGACVAELADSRK